MNGRALVLVLAALVACNDDAAPTHDGSGTGTTTSTGGSSTAMPSSSADESTTVVPEPMVVLDATLDLELKDSIRVIVTATGNTTDVVIDPSRGFGLVTGKPLGTGRIDAYPEADATVYTATFDGVAIADGPCGDAPVSLALSLHHDHDADVIAGGLTGYCGAGTFFGVPVVEPLRISGRVP